MQGFDWQAFMEQWSEEVLDSEYGEDLPQDVIESGWLGYAGASEAQIARAEERLGARLPPSYRAFLSVSNGWRILTSFIENLWPVDDVAWLRVRNQQFIDLLSPLAVSDQDYYVYGASQSHLKFRREYLQTALEISNWGDSAIYLLNPAVVTPEGEWEAWFYADWLPGANRYRSFQELMEAAHAEFVQQSTHYWSFGGEASTETR